MQNLMRLFRKRDPAPQLRCGEMAEYCSCERKPSHDGPHECSCGGSWNGSINGDDFEVIEFPMGP